MRLAPHFVPRFDMLVRFGSGNPLCTGNDPSPSGVGRQSFLSYTALSMRKIFLLVVCLALFAGASLAQTAVPASSNPPDAARLIGTWDGRTPDGMGATISFHDDSSMTFSPGVMIDFTAKPQGDE